MILKKYPSFLLLFGLMIIGSMTISCSDSNDDLETPVTIDSSLIGTWMFSSFSVGGGVNEPASECESRNLITLQNNGVFSFVFYDQNGSMCFIAREDSETWQQLSDSRIQLTYSENDIQEAIFSIANDELTLTFSDTSGESVSIYTRTQ